MFSTGIISLYRTPIYGYYQGGRDGNLGVPAATSARITFSTGALNASTTNNITYSTQEGSSLSDGYTYGYTISGNYQTTVSRITFSTGVNNTNTASALSSVRDNQVSISDGSVYGYTSGGWTTYSGTPIKSSDRMVFSTGVNSARTASDLSVARMALNHTGLSDGSIYGYAAGGNTGGVLVSTTDRITFSTGVFAVNAASAISSVRTMHNSLSSGGLYGYVFGGATAGATMVSTCDRMTFSTSVINSSTTYNLAQNKYSAPAFSDNVLFGYHSGGYDGAGYTSVSTQKITFSTGTWAQNTASNLAVNLSYAQGLSEGRV